MCRRVAADEQAVAACVFALNMSSVWHILRRAYIIPGVLGCQSLSTPHRHRLEDALAGGGGGVNLSRGERGEGEGGGGRHTHLNLCLLRD